VREPACSYRVIGCLGHTLQELQVQHCGAVHELVSVTLVWSHH
jgi:hypothetical protein